MTFDLLTTESFGPNVPVVPVKVVFLIRFVFVAIVASSLVFGRRFLCHLKHLSF